MKMRSNPVFILIVFFIVLMFIIFILYPKDCKVDKPCFDERFEKCRAAKFSEIKDNNFYDYRIIGKEGAECVFEVKLLRLEPGADITVKALLENKAMKCKIPINTYKNLEQIENMVTYCSGELKEVIYTLLVKRMYGSIVRNLGQIVEETRKVIK